MNLFATFPVDEVTVHDIAGAVGMTPAAVYYHFASKEQDRKSTRLNSSH